jgi:hypothetical protein
VIIRDIDKTARTLADNMSIDASNLMIVRTTVRECNAALAELRGIVMGDARTTIRRIRTDAKRFQKAARKHSHRIDLNVLVENIYVELRGLSKELRGLRDRRRAGP